jgi:RNA polymerase sigma factor (sigma-70 family)
MPWTNYGETVQDGEIVAAIVAGDPAGLAAAYDNYAPALYAYCRTLLSEPADAADAVQDTYLIAAVKLDGLRDPDRLRPWLYAVARNECFRRLRARGLSAPLDTPVEVTSNDPALALGPEREEVRDLVVEALSGLNPGGREVIELNLRHVLGGDDLADVLGISRNQAHALASRARSQFEVSLGALLVIRAGQECEELDNILAGWDGELTPLLRKRVSRHIENCRVCGERKRRELSPAMLLSTLPMVAIPVGLREQALRLADDPSPVAGGHRDMVAERAEPFDRSGFPKPLAAPRRVYGVQALTMAACVAVAAAVLLGTGTVLILGALHHKGPATASAATVGPAAVTQPPLSANSDQGVTPSPSSSGSSSGGGSKQHIGLTITVSGSPSPTPPQQGQGGPGGQGGQGGQPSSPSSPTPGHTQPSPSPSQTPPPSPGTLSVSPSSVTLGAVPSTASFTITASGGTVSYSIDNPAPAGDLAVSPSAGTLSAGQSVTVSVTVSSDTGLASETDLTVSPGGLTVAVLYPAAG